MKQEVRDNDVEFFGGCEPEHIVISEFNPIREAKNLRILFRSLWTGPLEAIMLKGINPNNTCVLIKFSTDAAQEPEATTNVQNFQLILSS